MSASHTITHRAPSSARDNSNAILGFFYGRFWGKMFTRVKNAFQNFRSTQKDASWWENVFDSLLKSKTTSGITVTHETAMQASTVYACVRVLSETIASLPVMVFRRIKNGGKEAAQDHPLYPILHDSPNFLQTGFDFFELAVGNMNMRGNHFCFKGRNARGQIDQLFPLPPDYVTTEYKDSKITYLYRPPDLPEQKYSADEIWHLKLMSKDGITGNSVISYAKESIGMTLAAQKFGSEMFSRKPVFSGVLRTDKTLGDKARDNLMKSLDEYKKEKRQGILILEEGLDWKLSGMTNEDAQYLQLRQFQVEEIARMFRVPCVLIGYADKTSTYASAEQFFLSFMTHTVRPWLVRLEQSANQNLLTEKERKEYFIEFKADGLLRGDTLSRYNAYTQALTSRWMSVNEVRGLENLNPIEGGDKYENPNTSTTPVDKKSPNKEENKDEQS